MAETKSKTTKKEEEKKESEPKAPTLTERVEVIEYALSVNLNCDLNAVAEKLGTRS